MAVATMDALIEQVSSIRGNRPILAGTGTAVRTIASLYKLGYSAEEIATELPNLSVGQIYAGLTYYHLHTDEIEADIQQDSEMNLQMQAEIR